MHICTILDWGVGSGSEVECLPAHLKPRFKFICFDKSQHMDWKAISVFWLMFPKLSVEPRRILFNLYKKIKYGCFVRCKGVELEPRPSDNPAPTLPQNQFFGPNRCISTQLTIYCISRLRESTLQWFSPWNTVFINTELVDVKQAWAWTQKPGPNNGLTLKKVSYCFCLKLRAKKSFRVWLFRWLMLSIGSSFKGSNSFKA